MTITLRAVERVYYSTGKTAMGKRMLCKFLAQTGPSLALREGRVWLGTFEKRKAENKAENSGRFMLLLFCCANPELCAPGKPERPP